MTKERVNKRMVGGLAGSFFILVFIIIGQFIAQWKGSAAVKETIISMPPQSTQFSSPQQSSKGVLAETTMLPLATASIQTPNAAELSASPAATESISTADNSQPPLLTRMMRTYNLLYDKLSCNQLLMLVYDHGSSNLYLYQKDKKGLWNLANSFPANVGRNGMSDDKTEGDSCTPTGLYTIGIAFGNAKEADITWPYREVTENSYWVDDPQSIFYNTWVEGTNHKDWASAERLSNAKVAYEYALVIEYNMDPVVPGKGSAIFLHCGNKPTAGCIAVDRDALLKILKWLDNTANPQILIATTD